MAAWLSTSASDTLCTSQLASVADTTPSNATPPGHQHLDGRDCLRGVTSVSIWTDPSVQRFSQAMPSLSRSSPER